MRSDWATAPDDCHCSSFARGLVVKPRLARVARPVPAVRVAFRLDASARQLSPMDSPIDAEERLQQEFADVGTKHGREFYVSASAVGRYIDACVRESLAIAGLDVFWLQGVQLKPDLSRIADFSSLFVGERGWDALVAGAAVEAREFVARVALEPEVLVDFVLISAEQHRLSALQRQRCE